MINRFQKALWLISSACPIFITFSMAWLINGRDFKIGIVFFMLGIVFITIFYFLFAKVRRSLSLLHIRVKKVTQNDKIIISYAISYLLPFASILFEKYNPFIFLMVAIIIFTILLLSNSPNASPLLLFRGYHFYDVETENGIGNYLIISKRTIRNKDELQTVSRINEYLLIDVSEGE